MSMLRVYFLIALRRLAREKMYAVISIASLALGIACLFAVSAYFYSELTYDRYHDKSDRIERLYLHWVSNIGQGEDRRFPEVSGNFTRALLRRFPQIGIGAELERVRRDAVLTTDERRASWDALYFADPEVFEIFTHQIVFGDIQSALDDPNSIVLSRSLAEYYFGDSNPVGQFISRGERRLRVTLVFEDFPENTHLRYNALLSMELRALQDPDLADRDVVDLSGGDSYQYLLLSETFDRSTLQGYLDRTVRELRDLSSIPPLLGVDIGSTALTRVHLFSSFIDDDLPKSSITRLLGLGVVTLLLLTVSLINFVNLATARALRRAASVGVQKILGAERRHLMWLTLFEAFIFAIPAIMLALGAIEILNSWAPQGLRMIMASGDGTAGPAMDLILVVAALAIVLLAALYPAIHLTRFNYLDNGAHQGAPRGRARLRKTLLFVQLFFAIGGLAAALLMSGQSSYLVGKGLGVELQDRIVVDVDGVDARNTIIRIRDQMGDYPLIENATTTSWLPETGQRMIFSYSVDGADGPTEPALTYAIYADNHFLETLGIELVAGGEGFVTDVPMETGVLINEAMVDLLEWDDPVGKSMYFRGRSEVMPVVGVVRDFHARSLHSPIPPLVIRIVGAPSTNTADLRDRLILELKPGTSTAEVERLMSRFSDAFPGQAFDYRFLEQIWSDMYGDERQEANQIVLFASLCIALALLGLYGISVFTTEQRAREISIRKVTGAMVIDILRLVSDEFVRLALLASVVASVISYVLTTRWLAQFTYHINPSFWLFLTASLIVFLLGLITIVVQAFDRAKQNPVESLRYE